MKKLKIVRLLIAIIIYSLFIFNYCKVFASEPNNKFGIHLAQPNLEALKEAANLVNSSGGDWGYVTLVIQENDRNLEKWQNIFDWLREFHLIPIIRLATVPEGSSWRRPSKDEATAWVNFLDSLNWVVKNRYVILFNEPNHGSEWGGKVDPKSYAQVAFELAKKLKEKNQDFFIMLAGFDASTPSLMPKMEDEEIFLKEFMEESDKLLSQVNSSSEESSASESNSRKNLPALSKKIFDYIDGWVSHSYPNPDFSGTPWDFGRGTIRTYQWELALLKNLGVTKQLPVFITESGWRRSLRLDEQKIADYFKIAFENVWLPDERVVAVTPFVLDYQGEPFLNFSWKRHHDSQFYQQYYTVQSFPKIKGEPLQREKVEINFDLPKELVAQSTYQFNIKLKNLGQAIWNKDEGYSLELNYGENHQNNFNYFFSDLKNIKPFNDEEITFFIKTKNAHFDNDRGLDKIARFILKKNGREIFESKPWQFKILPLPDLKIKVNFWPIGRGKGNDFEIQIFNTEDKLVFKKKGVKVENGQGKIKNIQNITLDELYRVVIIHSGYLPRQKYIVFQSKENLVEFKPMLPFDLNSDGKLDFKDFLKILPFI